LKILRRSRPAFVLERALALEEAAYGPDHPGRPRGDRAP